MKCKQCGREIPEAAIFCCWCGVKQLRERRKKDAIKVPKPRKLRSGAWNIELRAEGQSITEATAELCEARARAIRAGFIEAKKAAPKMTVDAALEAYIKSRALLALHSLRRSEIYALTAADVDLAKGLIRVEGAAVQKMEQYYSAEEQDEEAKKRS